MDLCRPTNACRGWGLLVRRRLLAKVGVIDGATHDHIGWVWRIACEAAHGNAVSYHLLGEVMRCSRIILCSVRSEGPPC